MTHLWIPKGQSLCGNNGGYVALISVLVISGALLMVALNIGLTSLDESKMGLQENQSWEAYNLASLCAEDAIMKLKINLRYAGGETLTEGNGSCYIYPPEGDPNRNKIIRVQGTVNGQTRKIEIIMSVVKPATTLTSWRQVADF